MYPNQIPGSPALKGIPINDSFVHLLNFLPGPSYNHNPTLLPTLIKSLYPSSTISIYSYSTTLRWLSNFGYAINAVSRPICKGAIFGNQTPAKLKLSRHNRKVKVSFAFPEIKVGSLVHRKLIELIIKAIGLPI